LLLFALSIIGFFVPFWLNRAAVHTTQTGFISVRWTLSFDDITQGQFILSLASLVVSGVAIIGINLGLRRHYRCPRCDAIPTGSWPNFGSGSVGRSWGIALFPSVCPNCGARLS
jgi:hypothetical protein